MTHTPGPWHLCNDGNCICLTIMSDDHPITAVTKGAWGDEYPAIRRIGSSFENHYEAYMEKIVCGEIDVDTAMANARLIAAAPDLLDVARDSRHFLNGMVEIARMIGITGTSDWDRLFGTNDGFGLINKINAAIAKAEGAQE